MIDQLTWLMSWAVMTTLGFVISLYSRLASEWEKTMIGQVIHDTPRAVVIGVVLTSALWAFINWMMR